MDKTLSLPVVTALDLVYFSSTAQGLLNDIERHMSRRVVQGLQGPPGPPGPPGYSRLFGSNTNVTDLVDYIKGEGRREEI